MANEKISEKTLEWVKNFRLFAGFIRSALWVVGGIAAGIASIYSIAEKEQDADYVMMALVLATFAMFSFNRALAYRRKNRRIYRAMEHVQTVVSEVGRKLGDELKALEGLYDDSGTGQFNFGERDIESLIKAQSDALAGLLQNILNSAHKTFVELSEHECTAVLLLSENNPVDGEHYRSNLYSDNVSQKRVKTTRPLSSNLLERVWASEEPVLVKDLQKEVAKGNFFNARNNDDPLQWYRTTMMCRFYVKREPFGIFAIDTLSKRALIEEYKPLFRVYSELCGVAFSLTEHGDLGNEN